VQAITHFAIGATVASLLLDRARPAEPTTTDDATRARRRRIALTAGAAAFVALTHVLVDDLARATYHPPDARWRDIAWLSYHAVVYLAILPVLFHVRRHAIVAIAALGPDLADWLVVRPLGLWEGGLGHEALRRLPGIAQISGALQSALPDLREEPLAAIPELLAVAGLLAFVHARRPRGPEADEPCPDGPPM